MSVSRRSHVVIAITGAIAAVVAGVLGNYLVNRWSWGLAIAVLTMIAIIAGLEGAKALITHRAASGTSVEQPDAVPTIHTASVLGGHVTMNQSVVAAGNVDQSRITHVHAGGLVAVIVAVSALLTVAIGTGRLAEQPGGRLAEERATSSPTRSLVLATPSPDSPEVALDDYIRAKFFYRSSSDVSRLECASSRLTSMNQLLSDIEMREAEFGVVIKVELGGMAVTTSGATAQISTDLALRAPISGSAELAQRVQRWRFDLTNESGWRVCVASQVP